ncbi:MAG: 30S ribosomal protein S9 [Candidatus Omnitrophica bacterium]|nr:30S ribosomal protein S9 [Candidatus Omnitrophota bacterium]
MDEVKPETKTNVDTPAEGALADAPAVASTSETPKRASQPKSPARPAPREANGAESSASKGQAIWATGRRKEAIARVRLIPGPGTIVINSRPYDDYFPRETLRLAIRQPLVLTHQLGKHNVLANVEGGGLTGQAGAVCLGIARAIVQLDPALRSTLRSAGLLTRDPRAKERKKYGQKGARKRFQWTKR